MGIFQLNGIKMLVIIHIYARHYPNAIAFAASNNVSPYLIATLPPKICLAIFSGYLDDPHIRSYT